MANLKIWTCPDIDSGLNMPKFLFLFAEQIYKRARVYVCLFVCLFVCLSVTDFLHDDWLRQQFLAVVLATSVLSVQTGKCPG